MPGHTLEVCSQDTSGSAAEQQPVVWATEKMRDVTGKRLLV